MFIKESIGSPWLTLDTLGRSAFLEVTDVGSQGLGLGHSPNDVRLKPDIYHCMDYHAALAPLYLEDDWKIGRDPEIGEGGGGY